MTEAAQEPILSVRNLVVEVPTPSGVTRLIDDVSFDVMPHEVFGIVGESGSGKTTLLRCIAGHIDPSAGEILFAAHDGITDLAAIGEGERRRRIGHDLGFVHQNPRDGLRLAVSAGANIAEPLMNAGMRHYGSLRRIAASAA